MKEDMLIDYAYHLAEEDSGKMKSSFARISWAVFLLLLTLTFLISLGAQMSVLAFAIGALILTVAWRYPYGTFYLVAVSSLLLGLTVSLPTGGLAFGTKAFGGSIDILVFEVFAGGLLVAWSLRMLTLWRGRRDRHWKPWLPLIVPVLFLVLAHVLSIFSPTGPDPIGIIKYALRPIFAVYLISVVLTVNFVQSEKRLRALLATIMIVALFFAFDGFRSIFNAGFEVSFDRARPVFLLFGRNPLGGNHNALAQMMLIGMSSALALGSLMKFEVERRLSFYSAMFMGLIVLLTLARSGWIALLCMLGLLSATIWRKHIRAHAKKVIAVAILLIPLAAYMVTFSLSDAVQGSTDARTVLTEIAVNAFQESPVVGIGAGTFTTRVGATYAYIVEFATARDAHGVFQKVLAETGSIGLVAFLVLISLMVLIIWKDWKKIRTQYVRAEAYMYLVAGALGAFVYQLFDTTYWTARLWLPIGIVLAAGHIFKQVHDIREPDFLLPRNI